MKGIIIVVPYSIGNEVSDTLPPIVEAVFDAGSMVKEAL